MIEQFLDWWYQEVEDYVKGWLIIAGALEVAMIVGLFYGMPFDVMVWINVFFLFIAACIYAVVEYF